MRDWNRRAACFVAILAFLLAIVVRVQAQSRPCPPPQTLLQKTDPAYADANELAQTLRAKGIEVDCMFPSKTGSMFMVAEGDTLVSTIEGEVAYQTDRGGFDAFFMPKPKSFVGFGVHRLRSSQGFLYIFSGTPAVPPATRFGTAQRNYFFKRDNYLLIAASEAMRAQLEQALGVKPKSP
jgi:hypothetical protein